MWFFGDGCFLMWGKNCWTSMIPEHRSAVTALDISIFLADTEETDADIDTEEIGPRPEGPEFPTFTQNSSFSQDFFKRFSFENVKKAWAEYDYEQRLNQFISEREAARTQRYLERKEEFDSSNLGIVLIKLGALAQQLKSTIETEYF